MINKLTVGTRESKLAITQTEIVTALRNKFPSVDFNVVTIKTKGTSTKGLYLPLTEEESLKRK